MEAQHVQKGWLMVISWRKIYVPFIKLEDGKEIRREKRFEKGI